MNLEIKKDLVSSWFKTLQDAFCEDIIKIEKSKTKFKSTNWKRNPLTDEGGGEERDFLKAYLENPENVDSPEWHEFARAAIQGGFTPVFEWVRARADREGRASAMVYK